MRVEVFEGDRERLRSLFREADDSERNIDGHLLAHEVLIAEDDGFYQRQGFRMLRIERDVFGSDAGYPEGIVTDGIPLRDRVWLDQEL